MQQTVIFIVIVGIGSTIALDLWSIIVAWIGWMPGTHWPSVGRWLLGLLSGRLVFDQNNTSPNTMTESVIGWGFHYIIGLAYAAMYPLFWGLDFLSAPTILPFLLIGVVVSTLAGLIILMPGMGAGLFARKTPTPMLTILYVLVAHVIFTIAQYLLALGLA
ncbi:DUF2938 family protein [Beijerinckia mobilis]|uniref:DUF2938 family protein n=1 Tax=Beijerinckia mobilis TaxID=231434 RepID=UPI00054E02A9|nr:DUF2938 family protein [Beijerinckia mobilis]